MLNHDFVGRGDLGGSASCNHASRLARLSDSSAWPERRLDAMKERDLRSC